MMQIARRHVLGGMVAVPALAHIAPLLPPITRHWSLVAHPDTFFPVVIWHDGHNIIETMVLDMWWDGKPPWTYPDRLHCHPDTRQELALTVEEKHAIARAAPSCQEFMIPL